MKISQSCLGACLEGHCKSLPQQADDVDVNFFQSNPSYTNKSDYLVLLERIQMEKPQYTKIIRNHAKGQRKYKFVAQITNQRQYNQPLSRQKQPINTYNNPQYRQSPNIFQKKVQFKRQVKSALSYYTSAPTMQNLQMNNYRYENRNCKIQHNKIIQERISCENINTINNIRSQSKKNIGIILQSKPHSVTTNASFLKPSTPMNSSKNFNTINNIKISSSSSTKPSTPIQRSNCESKKINKLSFFMENYNMAQKIVKPSSKSIISKPQLTPNKQITKLILNKNNQNMQNYISANKKQTIKNVITSQNYIWNKQKQFMPQNENSHYFQRILKTIKSQLFQQKFHLQQNNYQKQKHVINVQIISKKIKLLGIGRFFSTYLCQIQPINFIYTLRQVSTCTLRTHGLEFKIMNSLDFYSRIKHQNLLNVYFSWKTSQSIKIATEFGQPLDNVIKNRQLSQHQIVKILKDITTGISYIHHFAGQGFSLNCLKTKNIILINGKAKIQWFGIDDSIISPYKAPQIKRGLPGGKKSDIWSLGVIAYQLYYGRLPFKSQQDAIVFDEKVQSQLIKLQSIIISQDKNHNNSIDSDNLSQSLKSIQISSALSSQQSNFQSQYQNFLKQILESNQIKRLSAVDCLAHPLFKALREHQN